jgi:hypothetical protein
LPLPKASAATPISKTYFNGAKNYGAIYNQLSVSLNNSGYTSLRYFQVKEGDKYAGFAIMTAIEEIDKSGKRKKFWSEGDGDEFSCDFDLTCLFRKLSLSLKGYYRTILVVISDKETTEIPSYEPSTRQFFSDTYNKGAINFSSLSISEKATSNYKCIVYIYEFEKKQTSKELRLTLPTRLTINEHLQSAKLDDFLKK